MRRLLIQTMLATLLMLDLLGQTEADYKKWMTTIGATMGSMNREIAAKDSRGAAADAQKLEAAFKQVEDFWKQRRGVDDAVMLATHARTTAGVVAKDAGAFDLDEAAVQAQNLQGDCAACHEAHRKGNSGSFKIK